MLSEKFPLFIVNQVHDVVIVTNNQHDILLENAEWLSAVVKLGKVDMKVDKAVLCDLGPVFDLDQHLSKVGVKVTLEETRFARLGKQQVLVKERWLRVKQFLCGLNQNKPGESMLDVIVVEVDVLKRCRPFLENAVKDVGIQRLLQLLVLSFGFLSRWVVSDEVHAIDC